MRWSTRALCPRTWAAPGTALPARAAGRRAAHSQSTFPYAIGQGEDAPAPCTWARSCPCTRWEGRRARPRRANYKRSQSGRGLCEVRRQPGRGRLAQRRRASPAAKMRQKVMATVRHVSSGSDASEECGGGAARRRKGRGTHRCQSRSRRACKVRLVAAAPGVIPGGRTGSTQADAPCVVVEIADGGRGGRERAGRARRARRRGVRSGQRQPEAHGREWRCAMGKHMIVVIVCRQCDRKTRARTRRAPGR
jgi:hypothetical protein